jgi:hypothetical protein
MRSPARSSRQMLAPIPALGPTPEPICTHADCLACNLKRAPDETRSAFVDRLRGLYASGRLDRICPIEQVV